MSYGIIKSFRDLNTVKFEIIHEFETHLPFVFLALHVLALAVSVVFAVWGLPVWAW